MRLVTFNLQHGRGAGGRVDLERLRAAIRQLDPDVLGLQEVDQLQPRSGGADLTAIAAEAMRAVDARYVPALLGTPGADWSDLPQVLGGAETTFGIALASRYPVRSWTVLRLPSVGPHLRLRAGRWAIRVGEEPRVAVVADVESPAGPLLVANTHLSFAPGLNTAQLRWLVGHLALRSGPTVVLGDLNLPPRIALGVAVGFREAASHPTFPARRPTWQLDHILLRGELGPVHRNGAVRLPLSDHRALLVELEVGDGC